MNWSRVRAIIKKDIQAVVYAKLVMIPMIVMPLVLCIAVPAFVTIQSLFMILPLMASSIVTANSIVGEKERKTLETLLYTPVTNREFLVAKLLNSFIPAVLIGCAGFAGFFLVLNLIYFLHRNMLIIHSWIWMPAILLLSPSVSLIGLSLTLMVSLKAKSYA